MILRRISALRSPLSALRSCRGQVMILTTLTLGGVLLGATTIAGLLMVYQIRQTNDMANSAKAVFAADSGIEWGLYSYICDPLLDVPCQSPAPPLPAFTNGDTGVTVKCYDQGNNPGVEIDCSNASTTLIRSSGRSSRSIRVLEATF
ncbi:MAG: hypothetical protein HY978_03245 [Candidatus Liptonbacteria bacterium]|nr:hypothetical protein [Candidatus Liptonbacteria bacterium]